MTQTKVGDPSENIVGDAMMIEVNEVMVPLGDDNPLPITLTPSGTQDVNLTQVGGVAFALGQQLAASSLPVVLTATQLSTITPPAAITGFATSAKQDTLLAELQLKADLTETQPVSIASNATSTLSNVSSSATSVTILASNANRKGATIHNDSTAILYVKFGTTASTSSYTVKMIADAYYEIPFSYNGRIDGIWASANGSARVTEVTA